MVGIRSCSVDSPPGECGALKVWSVASDASDLIPGKKEVFVIEAGG